MKKIDSKEVYLAFKQFVIEDNWEDNLKRLIEAYNKNYVYPNLEEYSKHLPKLNYVMKNVSAINADTYVYGSYDIVVSEITINVPLLDLDNKTTRIKCIPNLFSNWN